MTRWTCPECGGGFPHAIFDDVVGYACPWCGYSLADFASEKLQEIEPP